MKEEKLVTNLEDFDSHYEENSLTYTSEDDFETTPKYVEIDFPKSRIITVTSESIIDYILNSEELEIQLSTFAFNSKND